MNIGKSRKTSDLAALDGATFGLDKAMTLVSFVLLFVIVFIPIFMICSRPSCSAKTTWKP